MDTVYSGLNVVGNVKSIFDIFISVIFGCILLGISYYYFTREYPYTQHTIATTTGYTRDRNKKNQFINNFTYTVSGVEYTGSYTEQSIRPKGRTFKIYYNIYDPIDYLDPPWWPHYKVISGLIFLFAIFVVSFSFLNRHLTKEYKPYSALQGADLVYNTLRR
jgi:hypothetical protein